jgi:TolB-like protein
LERPFPAYDGTERFIFVCYSHDDADLVYPEITRLHESGFHVWYDEGIAPGTEWSQALADSIQACAIFLYFVTPQSVDSEHCRREVNFALDQHCTTLVAHLQPTDVPPALQLTLSHRQAVLKYQHSQSDYEQKLKAALENAIALEAHPGTTSPSRIAGQQGTTPKIAVLPFANLTGDRDQEYFSNGMSREVWSMLTRLEGLRVISMTSSSSYKDSPLDAREIGRRLTADYIVEGTVNRSGGRARVSVHLVDTADGTEVWGETYERTLDAIDEIFALYDEISTEIHHALPPSISNIAAQHTYTPPTEHVAAYNLLQQAWFRVLDMGDPRKSMPLIERALDLDPNYALAHVVMAENLAVFAEFGYGPSMDYFLAAKAAAERALALDSTLAVPHLIRGFLHDRLDLDFRLALAECREGARLGAPAEAQMIWQQDTLLNAGLYEQGLELSLETEAVSPGLSYPKVVMARFLDRLGRQDEATRKFEEALAIAPGNAMTLSQILLHYFTRDRNVDRAAAIVADAGNTSALPDWGAPWVALLRGDPEPFKTLVDAWVSNRDTRHVRAVYIDRACFLLGDYAEHIHWFAMRVEERDALGWTMGFLRETPDYWTKLREWALGDAAKTRERLELIDQHRALMERVTEKMVV